MPTIEMSEALPPIAAEETLSPQLSTSKSGTLTGADTITHSDSRGDSIWRRRRRRFPKLNSRMLPNAHPEPRPFVNKYFFKRPRLLQYYDGEFIVDAEGNRMGPTNPDDLILSHGDDATEARRGSEGTIQAHLIHESHDPTTSKVQRDWLNLFIDLLWVGIVSNISSTFVDKAFVPPGPPNSGWGPAFLQFIVLFLAAFRFWSYLRKFLNNFFRKDFVQSLFLAWELILALFFGNQTQYLLDPVGGRWVIGTFLVARGSYIIMEAIYCIYIPSIRREFLVTSLFSVPITVLWGAALAARWPVQAALILPAVLLEGLVSALISLPVGDWFLGGAPRKALDPENLVDRLQNFFIIVLGEGVYNLVSGNNWGVGLSGPMLFAVEALIIYYSLFWLFFTGDHTKTYIHAIYRSRYSSLAFQGIHVLLFASILLLDASLQYIVSNSVSTTGSNTLSDADRKYALHNARWTFSASLFATFLFMTTKALLNRPLDPHGTLVIDNRYIRMAPRAVVAVVVMCLPTVENITSSTYLGVIVGLLQFLGWLELVFGMEKGAQLFEPRDS